MFVKTRVGFELARADKHRQRQARRVGIRDHVRLLLDDIRAVAAHVSGRFRNAFANRVEPTWKRGRGDRVIAETEHVECRQLAIERQRAGRIDGDAWLTLGKGAAESFAEHFAVPLPRFAARFFAARIVTGRVDVPVAAQDCSNCGNADAQVLVANCVQADGREQRHWHDDAMQQAQPGEVVAADHGQVAQPGDYRQQQDNGEGAGAAMQQGEHAAPGKQASEPRHLRQCRHNERIASGERIGIELSFDVRRVGQVVAVVTESERHLCGNGEQRWQAKPERAATGGGQPKSYRFSSDGYCRQPGASGKGPQRSVRSRPARKCKRHARGEQGSR